MFMYNTCVAVYVIDLALLLANSLNLGHYQIQLFSRMYEWYFQLGLAFLHLGCFYSAKMLRVLNTSAVMIDRWNSSAKISCATSFLEKQASYLLNKVDIATSGLKLKGTQNPDNVCIYVNKQTYTKN